MSGKSHALLIPQTASFSIAGTKPALWLSADYNVGTSGARVFDGTDQCFHMTSHPAYGTADFTVEGWFLTTAAGSDDYILGTGGTVNTIVGISIDRISGNIMRAYIADGTTQVIVDSTPTIVINKWYHIVVTVNRATNVLRIWINGVDVTSGTGSIAALSGSFTCSTVNRKAIGNYGGTTAGALSWAGSICKLRIALGYAYTAADIAESYALGNGKYQAELSSALAARISHSWNLNESAGSAIDCVGSNTATEVGTDATLSANGGPREATASDLLGNYHGVLTLMDTINAWKSDTPDGSYTVTKEDSVGSVDGTMTGFADVDAAHVDGPNGSWGPYIQDRGSGAHHGWLVSGVTDSRVLAVPSTLNTRTYDEVYTEPTSTGSRWFDGVDQRFSLASYPAYGMNSVTMEAWVYPTNTSVGREIIGTGATNLSTPGIGLTHYSSGRFCLEVGDGVTRVVTSPTFIGVPYYWYHVVGVVDRTANTASVYINGVLCLTQSIATVTGPLTPSGTNKAIGASSTAGTTYQWLGSISRARIAIGSAFTAAEVAESYNGGRGRSLSELSAPTQAKITHSWALDESSGNAIDTVGGNTGTPLGTDSNIRSAASVYMMSADCTLVNFTSDPRSATEVPAVLAGKCKSILSQDGKYVTTNVKSITGLGARTVAVWLKRNGAPASNETLFGEISTASNSGFRMYIGTNGYVYVLLGDGSGTYLVGGGAGLYTANVCDNNWHLVVFDWDGTTTANKARLTLDAGTPMTVTATGTSQLLESTNNTQLIGINGAATNEFQGYFCRPMIWDGRALSDAEIDTLYAGGDVTDGLAAEWRFMESPLSVDFAASLECNGTTTRVDCGHEVIGTGARTISAWVYVDSSGGGGYGRVCDNGKSLFLVYSTAAFGYTADALHETKTTATITYTQWMHVAVTCDADGHAEIFLNGKRHELTFLTTANAGTPEAGTTNLFIGNNSGLSRAFDGRICNVTVHNSVLTTAQIRQLSEGAAVGSPVGDWRFDDVLSLPYLSGCKAIRGTVNTNVIATSTPTVSGQTARTITGWVRRAGSPSATEYLYAECPSSSSERGCAIYFFGGSARIYGSIQNGSAQIVVTYAENATDGTWHHFALSWDGTTDAGKAIMYLDGVPATFTATGTTQGGASTNNLYLMGRSGGTPNGLQAELADVRVYPGVALTQAQIRSLIAGTDYATGITAQWKFGETPRSIASCADGYSLEFDNVDDYVLLPAALPQSLSGLGSVSASVWVKIPAAPPGSDFLFALDRSAGSARFFAYVGTSGLVVAGGRSNNEGSSQAKTTTAGLTPGMWHHIGVSITLATNSILIYIDGAAAATTGTVSFAQTTFAADGATSAIGFQVTTSNYLNGKLDDLRFYVGSVLSPTDFATLAAGGEPATAPTARWTMDDGPQYGEPSNGDPVCVWESRDNSRTVYSQSSVLLRPTYKQVGANNRPGLTFNNGPYLRSTDWKSSSAEGTIVAVAATGSAGTYRTIFGQADEASDLYKLSVGVGDATHKPYIASNGTNQVVGTATTEAVHVFAFDSSGAVWRVAADGTIHSLTVTGANNGDWFAAITGADSSTIGIQLTNVSQQPWYGDIYELLIWNTVLPASKLTKVLRRLATKYGITLSA